MAPSPKISQHRTFLLRLLHMPVNVAPQPIGCHSVTRPKSVTLMTARFQLIRYPLWAGSLTLSNLHAGPLDLTQPY